MRAFRSLILAIGILATGLVFAGSQAHAGVHVYVTAGPSAAPYYAEGGYASPYPGYSWAPAYYDAYGNYYPGRWIAVQGWRGREWREHEGREQEWRELRGWDGDGEGQGNWRRHEHRDRGDRRHENGDESR